MRSRIKSKLKSRLFIVIGLICIFAMAIVAYRYVKGVERIESNPIITEISAKDIKMFEDQFQIDFPENMRFVEAQYRYSFREPAVGFTFEIPVDFLSYFISDIEVNYEKEIYNIGNDKYCKCDNIYKLKNRQFTNIYTYPEVDGFKRFYISYYRPGQKIADFFKYN